MERPPLRKRSVNAKRAELERLIARLQISGNAGEELAKAKQDLAKLPKPLFYAWHGPVYEDDDPVSSPKEEKLKELHRQLDEAMAVHLKAGKEIFRLRGEISELAPT